MRALSWCYYFAVFLLLLSCLSFITYVFLAEHHGLPAEKMLSSLQEMAPMIAALALAVVLIGEWRFLLQRRRLQSAGLEGPCVRAALLPHGDRRQAN